MLDQSRIRLVLFDLDGTLLDTAPDMLNSLNLLRMRHNLKVLSDPSLGKHISRGARGMIEAGMPPADEATRQQYIDEFLAIYQDNLHGKTRLFAGLEKLLPLLADKGIRIGVVTNKAQRFAEPLLEAMGLSDMMHACVYGDSLPQRKPDPEPVIEACRQAQCDPDQTVFIGDDQRDIDAGRAAGCQTVAAGWGYILNDDHPDHWDADAMVETSPQLAHLLAGCEARDETK